MDAYIAYLLTRNSSFPANFTTGTMDRVLFGNPSYTFYTLFAQNAMSIFFCLSQVAAQSSEKFYANGYLSVITLWPFVSTMALILSQATELFEEASGMRPWQHTAEKIALCGYTASTPIFCVCSLIFLLVHFAHIIDKQPYSGGLAYYLLFIIFTLTSVELYFPMMGYPKLCTLLLAGATVLSATACVALSLTLFMFSAACSCRVSMKKYYKPAVVFMLLIGFQWNALWTSGRTLFSQILSTNELHYGTAANILLDIPKFVEFTIMFHQAFPTLIFIVCVIVFPQFRSPLSVLKTFTGINLICKKKTGPMGYPVQEPKSVPLPLPEPMLVKEVHVEGPIFTHAHHEHTMKTVTNITSS